MIELPCAPAPRNAVPRVLDFGGYIEPASGAQVQRVNRLGNRYAITIELPRMRAEPEGRIYVNRLARAMSEGVWMRYPLLDFYPGTPGAFKVDGGGQAGTALVLKGGTPRYAFKEGQPLTLVSGGQRFLDFIAEPVKADASGAVEIVLTQMLRVSPANNDAMLIAAPEIEGFLRGDPVSWELSIQRNMPLTFELHESR